MLKRYLRNVYLGLRGMVVALDKAVNAIVLLGDPRETVSSRMGKVLARHLGGGQCWLCRVLCKVLNWVDPGHCHESIDPAVGDWQVSP